MKCLGHREVEAESPCRCRGCELVRWAVPRVGVVLMVIGVVVWLTE